LAHLLLASSLTTLWRYALYRVPSSSCLFPCYSLEQNRFIRASLPVAVRQMIACHAQPIPIDRISRIRRDRNDQRTNDCFRFVTLLRMTTNRPRSPSDRPLSAYVDSAHPVTALHRIGYNIICQPLLIGRSTNSEECTVVLYDTLFSV